MRVTIDTNAYSALGKGDPRVRAIVEAADELVVSTIVLGELHAGFSLGTRKEKNRRELDEFLGKPGVTVLPPSRSIAERYGELIRVLREAGTPLPTNDIWIAATALESGCRVLSMDAHFGDIPGILTVL
jgi:tRNA(fMet)-specific endonuclease VapC